MTKSKMQAAEELKEALGWLYRLVQEVSDGDERALRALRNTCTQRQYVGYQLEIGRDQLAVLMGDDDDESNVGIDLESLARGE